VFFSKLISHRVFQCCQVENVSSIRFTFIECFGFRVQGLGFRVQGSGCGIEGVELRFCDSRVGSDGA